MTAEEEQRLLFQVTEACKENPNMFGRMVQACTYGIESKIAEERARASDFETVAVAYAAMLDRKRLSAKDRNYFADLIESKLRKWSNKTSMNWGA